MGAYPRKTAFVLWACEAMRHEGVTESEALYLLGGEAGLEQGECEGPGAHCVRRTRATAT